MTCACRKRGFTTWVNARHVHRQMSDTKPEFYRCWAGSIHWREKENHGSH